MKTNQVLGVMVGATLLCGAAFGQEERPQGPGPCGDGEGFRPPCERCDGPGMRGGAAGMGQRGPGMRGGAAGMEQRGPGMMMRRGGEGAQQRGPGGTCGQGSMRGQGPEGMERPGPRGGMRMGPEGGPRGLPDPKRLKEAGATDQQLEALKKFEEEQQVKRIDLQAAVEKAQLAFEQAVRNEAGDEKAALKAADALSQARTEVMKLGISSRFKVREILGAEVLKKASEQGPREGGDRPGRGPRPDGQGCPNRDAPTGDRPQAPEAK